MKRSFPVLALVVLLSSCGEAGDNVATNHGAADNAGDNNGGPVDRQVGEPETWTCGTVTRYAAGTYRHVSEGNLPEYISNPPCIGSHYGTWLAWGEYETPLDPGFYVHNLEHGGIAYLTNCPDGCEDELEMIRSYVADVPRDDGGAFRYTFGPVEGLPTRFAMAAWGVVWVGDDLCVEDMDRFRTESYRMAPEDVAVPGHRPDEQPGG